MTTTAMLTVDRRDFLVGVAGFAFAIGSEGLRRVAKADDLFEGAGLQPNTGWRHLVRRRLGQQHRGPDGSGEIRRP